MAMRQPVKATTAQMMRAKPAPKQVVEESLDTMLQSTSQLRRLALAGQGARLGHLRPAQPGVAAGHHARADG